MCSIAVQQPGRRTPPIERDHYYRRREQRNDLQRSEPVRMAAATAASSALPPDLEESMLSRNVALA